MAHALLNHTDWHSKLPLVTTLALVIIGGIFLLNRAEEQARDTTRKHHLEDIEQSLYFASNAHGTYPPYDQPSWCGLLNDPANQDVRQEIEEVLREQNTQYANQDKPFPTDPLAQEGHDYFYWKHSPAIFELYAILEQDDNNERNTGRCWAAPSRYFDYGITSTVRRDITPSL